MNSIRSFQTGNEHTLLDLSDPSDVFQSFAVKRVAPRSSSFGSAIAADRHSSHIGNMERRSGSPMSWRSRRVARPSELLTRVALNTLHLALRSISRTCSLIHESYPAHVIRWSVPYSNGAPLTHGVRGGHQNRSKLWPSRFCDPVLKRRRAVGGMRRRGGPP